MKNTPKAEEGAIHISERAVAHHLRYFGTAGFYHPDGSVRVPTEEEVVAQGWEPESYLTSPIPTEPTTGGHGLGRTSINLKN